MTAAYSPALLSARLHATADSLETRPVAVVVVDALRRAQEQGHAGHQVVTGITWALRDAAAAVDDLR